MILVLSFFLTPDMLSNQDILHRACTANPEDAAPRYSLADLLQEENDPRGKILQLGCELRDRLGDIAFPDSSDAFWVESRGWEVVERQLEALSQHPENTAVFREHYQRLLRGDIPLDPEHLEATLRLQYDLQIRLLTSLNLLGEHDVARSITGVDGRRYPVPSFADMLARVQTPDLQEKLRQGFDSLLLVPFGLPLQRFIDSWGAGLRRNAARVSSLHDLNRREPVWAWDQYQTEPLVYDPHSFTTNHGGRTKEELLAANRRSWDVLLVEGALQNLPREGEGRIVGGRQHIECGRTPAEYLRDLPEGEMGLTPEAYIVQFLDALERRGQVLDVDTYSFLHGAFLPSSRYVPVAYWYPEDGQAHLAGVVPGDRSASGGVRVAVRVG